MGWKKYICCVSTTGTSNNNINHREQQEQHQSYEYVEGGHLPPMDTIEVVQDHHYSSSIRNDYNNNNNTNASNTLPPPPPNDQVGHGGGFVCESSTISSSADHLMMQCHENYRRNLDAQVEKLTEILEAHSSRSSLSQVDDGDSTKLSIDATTTKTEDMDVIRRMNRAIARDDWSAVEKEHHEIQGVPMIVDDDIELSEHQNMSLAGYGRHSVIEFSSSSSDSSSSSGSMLSVSHHTHEQSFGNSGKQSATLISSSSSDEEYDVTMANDLDYLLDSYRKKNFKSSDDVVMTDVDVSDDDEVDKLFAAVKQSLTKDKRKSVSKNVDHRLTEHASEEERRIASDMMSKSVHSIRSIENKKLIALEL